MCNHISQRIVYVINPWRGQDIYSMQVSKKTTHVFSVMVVIDGEMGTQTDVDDNINSSAWKFLVKTMHLMNTYTQTLRMIGFDTKHFYVLEIFKYQLDEPLRSLLHSLLKGQRHIFHANV